MIEFLNILGFAGTFLVAVAYLPQIIHLIHERCSYGISIQAWVLWIAADFLMLPRAVIGKTSVFIALLLLQIFLSVIVLIFSSFYSGKTCPLHKTAQ